MVSASGGSGLAGGGGGRVSIAVFSWHDEPHIFVHGMIMICPTFSTTCLFFF